MAENAPKTPSLWKTHKGLQLLAYSRQSAFDRGNPDKYIDGQLANMQLLIQLQFRCYLLITNEFRANLGWEAHTRTAQI